MSIKPIISVGFNKQGEADFEVNSAVYDLTPDRLNELSAMCFAAFHAAYSMRDRNQSQSSTGSPRNDYEETKAKTGFAGGTRRFRPEGS